MRLQVGRAGPTAIAWEGSEEQCAEREGAAERRSLGHRPTPCAVLLVPKSGPKPLYYSADRRYWI